MPLINWVAVVMAYFSRTTPFPILLFALYFVLPSAGLNLGRTEAAVVALTLHSGGYISEIVRRAFQSVPKGQSDAALSLGMSRMLAARVVLMPQALRMSLGPLAGQVILLVKDTSVISLIGVTETTRVARQLSQVYHMPSEVAMLMGTAAAVYFVICYPLSLVGAALERRTGRGAQGVFFEH